MKYLLIALLTVVCATAVFAQAPYDVPRDHWAYEAVEELASKGYVLGYPDGKFLGNRAMTRYEFATVIKRILDSVEAQIGPLTKVDKPTTTGNVTMKDLETIKKLVDEFKVELTVIGTRLDKVEEEVEMLKSTVKTHDAILEDEEGALKTAVSDISKLKKVKVSGYVQARWTWDEAQTAADETNSFSVRRARIKVTGNPTNNVSVTVQPDLAENQVTVKDAYVEYFFAADPALGPTFRIGQYNWLFGYDVVYSSSRREVPERSRVARLFFPGERDRGASLIGATNSPFKWSISAYDGNGTVSRLKSPGTANLSTGVVTNSENWPSSRDVNKDKDILANIQYAVGDLNIGFSGYWGKGVYSNASGTTRYTWVRDDKIRYGADLQWFFQNFTLKAEYIKGKGVDGYRRNRDEWIEGYWAQIAFNFNPKNAIVARYNELEKDPTNSTDFGRLRAWDLGYIHWLDENMKMKFFYQINEEQRNKRDNNQFIAEWVATY